MSPSDRRQSSVLWITLQLLFALLICLRQAMASFAPYISEFEYSPEFHPSRNPSCPRRWARGAWDERRSPEEGGPVGQEPSIEIRAVLVRCPKSHEEMAEIPPGTGNMYNITAGRSQDILEFHGFDRDEPARHTEVRNCRRKLIVTMKFNNVGKTKTQEEFVVVDHVLDPVTMHKARLLNPFVFKVRQEQVLQLYGLKFQSVVNGEAKEEVINKRSSNYTGCDDSLVSPTCGQMMFEGQPIPYSQGFCCSCDPDVNLARQPSGQSPESLALGTSQKIMPNRNEKQTPSRDNVQSRSMFAPLFASPKISEDPSRDESSRVNFESSRNPSLSKRERSLKSSRAQQAGLSDDDGEVFGDQSPPKNLKEFQLEEDYQSVGSFLDGKVHPALRAALSDEKSPSRGKIEPNIDAVRKSEAFLRPEVRIIDGNGGELSSIKENFDGDIFGEFKRSDRQKFADQEPRVQRVKYQNLALVPRGSDLTSELLELEREYETLKKSRRKEEAKKSNHSTECKDFRKLARGPDRYFSRNPELTNQTSLEPEEASAKFRSTDGLDLRKNYSTTGVGKGVKLSQKMNHDVYPPSGNNVTSKSNSSALSSSSNELDSTIAARNLSSRSTVSSNNTKSISSPGLILRQELVNDKLTSGDTLANVSSPGNTEDRLRESRVLDSRLIKEHKLSVSSRNSGTSEGSEKWKSRTEGGLENGSPLKTVGSAGKGRKSIKPDSIELKGSLKDQFADWVIKYGKMHSNHYINSQLEEPYRKYDLDLDQESSTDSELFSWSRDPLSQIAEKVFKEFESAEDQAASFRNGGEVQGDRPNGIVAVASSLNSPATLDGTGNLENLQSPRSGSAMTRDARKLRREGKPVDNFESDGISWKLANQSMQLGSKNETGKTTLKNSGNSSKTWQEILSSKVEATSEVRPVEKLRRKSNGENSTADSSRPSPKNHTEESGKRTIEPAVIVRGSGDMVKGDFRYQEQSATVIADRRSDERDQSATDQDYIFLDADGKEERLRSLAAKDLGRSMNLQEHSKSNGSNNSGSHLTGIKVSEVLLDGNGHTADSSAKEKFNRLDNLVRESLRSRRRSFRSIAYDDPFRRGNDKKQANIDRQIEKEFAEISEALNESSDGKKNPGQLSPPRRTDSRKDAMLRDFAVMLNRIPKNDAFKTAGGFKEAGNGIKRLKDFRKHDHNGGKSTVSNSRKRNGGNSRVKTLAKVSPVDKIGQPISGHETQTNINEIVKQVIKDDYRPQEYLERGKNVAEEKAYKESRQRPGENSTLKGISQGLHIGKLKKKCHQGIASVLYDDENDDGRTLPPDEPTVLTTPAERREESKTTMAIATGSTKEQLTNSSTEVGVKEGPKIAESTIPPEVMTNSAALKNEFTKTTTPSITVTLGTKTYSGDRNVPGENLLAIVPPISVDVAGKTNAVEGTGSTISQQTTTRMQSQGEGSHSTACTDPVMLETEISIPEEFTTTQSSSIDLISRSETVRMSSMNRQKTRRLSSANVISELEKFSNEYRDQKNSDHFSGLDEGDAEEHRVMERSPMLNSRWKSFPTTLLQYDDGDFEYGVGTIPAEEFSDPEKTRLKAENLELRKELEEVMKANGNVQTTGQDDSTDEPMATTFIANMNTDEETSSESTSGTSQPTTNANDNEILTVYEQTTDDGATTSSTGEFTALSQWEVGTENSESTKPGLGMTTYGGEGSIPSPEIPKGPERILRLNNTGESSVILVKTYSVSSNPREFLDNYEFPVGVKKVLLKRLNVTALIHDPVDFDSDVSFTQKINELVVNGREDAAESESQLENGQTHKTIGSKMKKLILDDDLNGAIDRREASDAGCQVAYEKLPDEKKSGVIEAVDFSSQKNLRTIHEPSIDDLKLQQIQEEGYKNLQLSRKNHEAEEGDAALDLDLVMNGLREKAPDIPGHSNNEFVRNSGLKVTRSFATADTLPPDDETTHFSSNGDVNATNYRLEYVMEQPIFPQQNQAHVKHRVSFQDEIRDENNRRRSDSMGGENLKEAEIRDAEIFYDYDSNANEVERVYRSSEDFETTDANHEVTIRHGRLKKREATDPGDWRSSAIGNRSFLYAEKITKAGRSPEIIEGVNGNNNNKTAPEPRCSDAIEVKWQGKMDLLKLKKHQDILKEYLNWSPNIDTTMMRIFSIHSTSGIPRTTEATNYLGENNKKPQESATMSILLIEENPVDRKPEESNQRHSGAPKTSQIDDMEILEKLRKMPIDDSLVIMPLIPKNKSNMTEAAALDDDADGSIQDTQKPKRYQDRQHEHDRNASLKAGEKLDGDNRRRRNIKFSRREARNTTSSSSTSSWTGRSGRRLMSAVQLSENKDNGLWDEDTMPEAKEEVVGEKEGLQEYENQILVPRGKASRFEYLDSSYKKRKRDKLKSNWDQLVDKIIVKNSNNENPSDKKRNSNKKLLEDEPIPLKGKSAMDKLHFFDADKYIESMAKQINRLSSVDNTEHDLAAEREAKVKNESERSVKLHQKREQTDDKPTSAEDEKNRAFEDSVAEYGAEIPYETGSELVKDSAVGQGGLFGKLGSDFEISISGKVHIDGASGNQPMSISIEGVSMDNETSRGNRIQENSPGLFSGTQTGRSKNETDIRIKQADHLYFDNVDLGRVMQDEIPANGYDKKQMFLGEAGSASSSPNIIPSIEENRDLIYAEKPQVDSRVSATPQKTFYNVVVRAHPRYEKFPVKSTRDFTLANESSDDLGEDSETQELRDLQENDLGKNFQNLTADEPVFDFAKLELRQRKPPPQNFEDEGTATLDQLDDRPSSDDTINDDLNTNNLHSRERRTRRLRRERAMIRQNVPGEASSDKSLGSTPLDIELVKLIPVELLNGNGEPPLVTEQRTSFMERKPVDLVTSELPKMDMDPDAIPGAPNKTKIKPVRHSTNNSTRESTSADESLDSKSRRGSPDLEQIRDADVSRVRNYLVKKAPEIDRYNERSKSSGSRSDLAKSKVSKSAQDTGEPEAPERGKTIMYKAVSPKFASKLAEPCFGEKEIIKDLDEPRNLTDKNSSRISATVKNLSGDSEQTNLQEGPKKVRLSTDDLRSSSAQPFGKTGEILIKGVKISSPGENPDVLRDQEEDLQVTACGAGECEVDEDFEGSRKATELKNLMAMMTFIKKLEDILPGLDNEVDTLDESLDPKAVVEVHNVLVVPEDPLGMQMGGSDEIKQTQTTSENVVEIGEGVRHKGDQRRPSKPEDSEILLLGNPIHVKSLPIGKDVDKNLTPGKDQNKKSPTSDLGTLTSGSRSKDPRNNGPIDEEMKSEKDLETAAKMKALFITAREKFKHRISELEKQSFSTKGSSGELSVPEKNLRRSGNDGHDASKVNDCHSLRSNPGTGSKVVKGEGRVHPDEALDDRTVEDSLQGKGGSTSRGLSPRKVGNGFGFKKQSASPGTTVRQFEFDEASSQLNKNRIHGDDVKVPEMDKIVNVQDKVGSPDLARRERRVDATSRRERQSGQQARTPVTYAVNSSDTKAIGLKDEEGKLSSAEAGGLVRKEKRTVRNSEKLKRKTPDGKKRKKRRRGGIKKKFRRKPTKKRKKPKIKKKTKKKKWWPFKRSLLAVIEDQEGEEDRGKVDFQDQDQLLDPIPKARRKKARSKPRKKRQIKAGGAQVRGGQDCMDRRHPAHVDSAKYQESAHCLRFSDLWYSVYELENPIMEHTVYLQLFEKHTLPDGTTHWDDLTQGSMVRLGTFVRHQRDSKPTISFAYSGAKVTPQKQAHNLDPLRDRLLVPSPVAGEKLAKYPQVKGGSGEYLVVQSNAINREGNECDKAGVSFSTFATQPNRCGRPKGTCLKNQPLAYWRHDVEAREAGKPGCYFLSNFASVPNNPIKYNVSGTGSREYLGLEYHSPHVSAIDIEVRADYNAIVRIGSSGRVTEVYVDSTAPEHTVVTIVISNMGLASSPYQSRISDCPTGLPVSWSKAKTAMQVIPPQHDQRITLDLYGELFIGGFHCSVEVVNHRGELVAMRRIRVQKMDRCFCVWHCLCACIGSVAGLGCQPMSPEHYHAAGFQGPVPVPSMEQSAMANAIKDVMIFSALVVLVLLGLGMLKWLIGIFVPVVSRWGLDVLLAGSQIVGYFEPELRCRSIVTDLEGRIVHPDTGKKSVRICSRRSEFFLNLTFLLTYPIAVCSNCVRSSLAGGKRNCCQDESKISLLRENEAIGECCPKLICVDTYGDSRNSKMEAEDTRYVMNELKRSRDSLQEGIGKRCKVGLRNRK